MIKIGLTVIQFWLGNGHQGPGSASYPETRGRSGEAPAQNHVEELGDFQTPWKFEKASIIEERLSQEIQNVLLTSIQ